MGIFDRLGSMAGSNKEMAREFHRRCGLTSMIRSLGAMEVVSGKYIIQA